MTGWGVWRPPAHLNDSDIKYRLRVICELLTELLNDDTMEADRKRQASRQ